MGKDIIMKLYDVPNGSKIITLKKPEIPPASKPVFKGDALEFVRIDGMYGKCWDIDGEAVYIAAWTEVEVVK